MVFRILMQLLSRFGHTEQVIQKLSESRPMRRTAQFAAYLIHRSKAELASNNGPYAQLRNRLFNFKKSFLHEFREEMSKVKKQGKLK